MPPGRPAVSGWTPCWCRTGACPEWLTGFTTYFIADIGLALVGLFALLREALPDLPLHASTQMSVFTAGGANEVYVDGCERVVLARECSREDTAAICKACPAEIEIFGHGALCMCYSGQCEMSALIGGRSGNRGTCAQPCRLPYGFNGPAKNTYPSV